MNTIDGEAIIEARVRGESVRTIARRMGCTIADIHDVLDRFMTCLSPNLALDNFWSALRRQEWAIGDALIREGKVELQSLPIILGSELSGIVEAIGSEVSEFKVGIVCDYTRWTKSQNSCCFHKPPIFPD